MECGSRMLAAIVPKDKFVQIDLKAIGSRRDRYRRTIAAGCQWRDRRGARLISHLCGVRIVGVEPVSRRRMGGSAANTIAAHRKVTIARAQMTLTFPASFVLIAAMNPCPCGFANDFRRECFCTPPQIQRYRPRAKLLRMRSQTYGDKQRDAQRRKKQEELRKKLNPEGAPTSETSTNSDKSDQPRNNPKKEPGRRSA